MRCFYVDCNVLFVYTAVYDHQSMEMFQGTPCLLSFIVAIEAIMGVVEKSSFRDFKGVLTLSEFSCSVKNFMDLNCHQNPDCDNFHDDILCLARSITISVE